MPSDQNRATAPSSLTLSRSSICLIGERTGQRTIEQRRRACRMNERYSSRIHFTPHADDFPIGEVHDDVLHVGAIDLCHVLDGARPDVQFVERRESIVRVCAGKIDGAAAAERSSRTASK